jgi:tetratricopeptide (TPR) repeat protein
MEIMTKRIVQIKGYHNILKFADKMITMFPFLQKDKNMKNYFIYMYSNSIAESYKSGYSGISDEYLEKLEALIKESPDMSSNEDQVVQVYNQAATYYYSRGDYAAALKSLERGLKFLPDSWILKERHKTIANHKPNAAAQRSNKNLSKFLNRSKNNTKFLEAQAYAKLHRDSINTCVAKYLPGKWKANSPNHHRASENIILTYLENNKIRMAINDNVQVEGTWKFNKENSVLSLNYGDFTDEITILIMDINEKTIRGMAFNANGFIDTEEVTMTRLSENISPSSPTPK